MLRGALWGLCAKIFAYICCMKVKKKKLPKANYDSGPKVGEKRDFHVKVDSRMSTSSETKTNRRGKTKEKLRQEFSEKSTQKDMKTGDVTKLNTSSKKKNRVLGKGTKEKLKRDLEVKDKHGRTTMKSRQRTNKRGVTRERGYIVRDGKKERYRGRFKA